MGYIIPTILILTATLSCTIVGSGNVSYHVIRSTTIPTSNITSQDVIGSLDELKNHRDRTRFAVQKILVPVVVVAGLLGNAINIAILTQKVMRTSSTNIYLTALAIYDILYLVFVLIMSFKHYTAIANTDTWKYYYKPFGKPLIDIFSNTAVWLTLTFTVERYIGVCHPMKGKIWCTPNRARYVVVFVVCAAMAITFPEFFEYRAFHEAHTGKVIVTNTPFGSTPSYRMVYVYLNQALFTFLPLILLFIFNALLTRAVMIAAHRRQALTVVQTDRQERQHREQTRITIMLIIVVVVFLMCQLPQAVQNLYMTYLIVTDTVTEERQLYLTITANIFNLLVTCNAATNFIWYSCFSMKFRRTFKRLLCRCLLKKHPRDHLFSDAGSEGSKSNLVMNAAAGRLGSPRRSPLTPTSTSCVASKHVPRPTDKTAFQNRNGYLKVNQGSFV